MDDCPKSLPLRKWANALTCRVSGKGGGNHWESENALGRTCQTWTGKRAPHGGRDFQSRVPKRGYGRRLGTPVCQLGGVWGQVCTPVCGVGGLSGSPEHSRAALVMFSVLGRAVSSSPEHSCSNSPPWGAGPAHAVSVGAWWGVGPAHAASNSRLPRARLTDAPPPPKNRLSPKT